MKATTEKKATKQRRTAISTVPAPEPKPEAVAIAPRVVKRGTCSTLNSKGELGYAIGVDSRGEVHLRVVENSGAGSFSDEWIAFKAIQAAFDRAPKSEPVSAYMLDPLARGKSSNCCYFWTAVLKREGVLQPSAKRRKRFDRVDPTAWLAELRNLADDGGAAGKKTARSNVKDADVAKPKKSNKRAAS